MNQIPWRRVWTTDSPPEQQHQAGSSGEGARWCARVARPGSKKKKKTKINKAKTQNMDSGTGPTAAAAPDSPLLRPESAPVEAAAGGGWTLAVCGGFWRGGGAPPELSAF